MAEPNEARLSRLAREARAFLEPHWERWHREAGSPPGKTSVSQGTCGRSSQFLAEMLREEGFETELAFGSPVTCPCGFRSANGWRGHAWVICHEPARIIDLTADQFGAPPVIVTTPDDPRYIRGEDVADEAVIAARQKAAQALLADWHRHHATA